MSDEKQPIPADSPAENSSPEESTPPSSEASTEPAAPVLPPEPAWKLPPDSRHLLLVFAGLLVLGIFVFQPVLHGAFLWDDNFMIVNNPAMHASDGLSNFWMDAKQQPDYWPMTYTTFWFEWQAWGARPFGFHLVNLLLHVGAATFLWMALRRLRIPGAIVAAALFVVHPVNVESVAWIIERKNTLSMFFAMLAAWCYAQSGAADPDEGDPLAPPTIKWTFYRYALIAFLFAMLAKSSVAMLPFVLLLLVVWRRRKLAGDDLLRLLPFIGVAVALAAVGLYFQTHNAIHNDIVREDSLLSRTALAGRAVWFYLSKLVTPFNLIFVYPRWKTGDISAGAWMPDVAIVLVLAILGVAAWRGSRIAATLLIGFVAYLLLLFPALGFFKIYFMRYSLVSDHWQYLATAAAFALVAGGAAWAISKLQLPTWAGATLAALLIAGLALRARQQTHIYISELDLWGDTARRNPDAWIAHNNYSTALREAGRLAESLAEAQTGLRQNPTAQAYLNLGMTLRSEHRRSEALAAMHRAIQVNPEYSYGYYQLGMTLEDMGQLTDALEYLQLAAQAPNPSYHTELGWVLEQLQQYDVADSELQKAITLDGSYAPAYQKLAQLYIDEGKSGEAVDAARKALELNPRDAESAHNIGFYFATQKDFATAEPFLRTAATLRPDKYEDQLNLAAVLMQLARNDEAAGEFKRALELIDGEIARNQPSDDQTDKEKAQTRERLKLLQHYREIAAAGVGR